uniref:Uncharacterized protein n=1 Tax=Meloidogyne hapla TaxID=6305 RepID=A0A1I8B549_MELHA
MREKLTVETDRHIAYLTIYSSSNDEEAEGNCSSFDSGTGDSKNKKSLRDKKLKEEKIVGGKEGGDQIDGKISKNVLLNEESSILDYNKNQQKYNLIEETSGYISMLQLQNNAFEPKPGSSQQQQILEPKNHSSFSPLLSKNNKEKSSKQREENNFAPNSPLPPLPKNLNEISERIDHPLPFLRRRNFSGSNGRGKENNNSKLQHKPSHIANRTSVLLLEDRPLPQLPISTNSDDDEIEDGRQEEDLEEPEPPVYVNSTNDSGLGGSSNAPKDYANTKTR